MIRISLDGNDFGRLVRGQKILCGGELVEIILSDIGFGVMRHLIEEAEREQNEKSSSSDSDLRERTIES